MRRARWVVLALTVGLVAFSIGDKERGNRLYREGKYAEAAAAYAKALRGGDDSPELHYDYGTALLRLGRYAEAEQHFRAALRGVEPGLRQHTLYNLGNRYLYAARAASDPASAVPGAGSAGAAAATPGATAAPDTKSFLDAAVKAYEQALRIEPRDVWAKWNLELALKERQKQQGGGGGQQKRGGGGRSGQQSSRTQPQGNPLQQPGQKPDRRQMSQAEADRILSAAENDERQLYKEKVRKGNREVPVARDW